MKLKKLVKCSLATALILGSVGTIVGCNKDNDTVEKTEQEKTYDLYVQYMNSKGDTPLTYEQWLETVKGDKGDKGDPGEDAIAPQIRIDEDTNEWEVSTDNGETWVSTGVKATGEDGDDATYSSYTVTYDYGKAKDLFNNAIDTYNIKSTEWMTALPEIKEEYKDGFLGWYIEGSDKQITNYDFIGGDVTLVAKFNPSKLGVSGLYQDGKYVKNWGDILLEYSGAFRESGSKIVSDTYSSYFVDMVGFLVIDNSITIIDSRAFQYCENLEGVFIPSSVTSIYYDAFSECENLIEINVDSENNYYSSVNGVLFDKDRTTLEKYPMGKVDEIYEIPNKVTTIDDYAFESCNNLKTIIVPSSVSAIFNNSISNCISLEEIVVDERNELYSSQDGVLFNKDKTRLIKYPTGKDAEIYEIPNSVIDIGSDAFSGCSRLIEIEIPNTVTIIRDFAFSGCSGLTDITIPNSVTTIKNRAFINCDSLINITIPSGVTFINWSVFYGCDSLISVTIESSSIRIVSDILTDRSIDEVIFDTDLSGVEFGSGSLSLIDKVYLKENQSVDGVTELENFAKQDTSDKAGFDLYIRVTE